MNSNFFITDVPIWSKMETGRIPSPQEMFQIIENNIKMNKNEVN